LVAFLNGGVVELVGLDSLVAGSVVVDELLFF
jgi:hypothetical protein